MCGEHNDTRARFCSACGVDLDAQVLLDPVADAVEPEVTEERRGLAMLFVPLGVVVAIGLTVLVLVSGGDDGDEDPDPQAVEGVVEAPTATPLPTPTATPFRVTLPESTPPQPTPTRTPSPPTALAIEPADLSLLPATDATHLAIAHDRDLAYLDLATGAWTLHERVSMSSVPGVDSLTPFAGGVVTSSGDALFYIPVDERPQLLGTGEPLGVVDGLFWARVWDIDSGPRVLGFDERGDQSARFELPAQTWVVDVLEAGVFLVQAGGRLFTHVGDRTEVVATGNFAGAHGDRFLVFSCSDDLESCGYSLIDAVEGSQVAVQVPITEGDSMQLTPDGRILVWEAFSDGAVVYELDADGTVVTQQELDSFEATQIEFGLSGEAIATDTTGLYARIDGDRLLFHGPTGDAITEVGLDFLPGFGDSYALAFVNSER